MRVTVAAAGSASFVNARLLHLAQLRVPAKSNHMSTELFSRTRTKNKWAIMH